MDFRISSGFKVKTRFAFTDRNPRARQKHVFEHEIINEIQAAR